MALSVTLGIDSPASAPPPPIPAVPSKQSFDELAAELAAIEKRCEPEECARSLAAVSVMIDSGRRMLIADRVATAAALAEQVEAELVRIRLEMAVDALERRLEAREAQNAALKRQIDSILIQLEKWRSEPALVTAN